MSKAAMAVKRRIVVSIMLPIVFVNCIRMKSFHFGSGGVVIAKELKAGRTGFVDDKDIDLFHTL